MYNVNVDCIYTWIQHREKLCLYWNVKLCEIINDSNGTINFSLFALVDCCILLSCFVVVIDAIHGKGIEKKTTNDIIKSPMELEIKKIHTHLH